MGTRHLIRLAVVLGEDDIPYFDVTVVFNIFKEELVTQMLRIVFLTAVIEDLGVRSARAFTDLPEVVFRLADVAWIQIGLGRPDAVSFIVIRIDGDIHAVLVKTDPLR